MTAGPAFHKIATATISSPTFTATFSNLGSYTDLLIVSSYAMTSAGNIYITYNGSSANVTTTSQFTSGSTLSTNRLNTFYINSNSTVSGRGVGIFNLFSYSATNNYKTAIAYHANPSTNNTHSSGTWLAGSAITSISINGTAQFDTGSIFSLYGIEAA
jgi:hypothetical protein